MTETIDGPSTIGASQASHPDATSKDGVRRSAFLALRDGSWRVQQSVGASGARQASSVLIPAHAGMRDARFCTECGMHVITADDTTVTTSQTAMSAAPRIRITSTVTP